MFGKPRSTRPVASAFRRKSDRGTAVASAFRRKSDRGTPVASAFRRKSTAFTRKSLDRRDFLKATVASPLVLRSFARQATDAPVVIVGAGLAGLRAAELLRKAGRPVVVLEARSRPGGRVHTMRSPFAEG